MNMQTSAEPPASVNMHGGGGSRTARHFRKEKPWGHPGACME